MTLFEIKSAAARYLEKDVDELIQNETDMGLVALNNIRSVAELSNDFNFTYKLLQLDVDGVTGGSLDSAVEYGDASIVPTTFQIKTIVDVGLFDIAGTFIPVDWTTSRDSLNIERLDTQIVLRYPTDAQVISSQPGRQRFVFSGNKVFYYPKTENLTFSLGIGAYTFTPDWTYDDINREPPDGVIPYNGPWTKHGSQYLLWSTVIHLNHLFKGFVFRQEGNLPPPQALADLGLDAMLKWDNFMFEQFRRHSR